MADRCGPLCQHPGCWHAGAKSEVYSKRHAAYLQFLEALVLKHSQSPPQEKTVVKGETKKTNTLMRSLGLVWVRWVMLSVLKPTRL